MDTTSLNWTCVKHISWSNYLTHFLIKLLPAVLVLGYLDVHILGCLTTLMESTNTKLNLRRKTNKTEIWFFGNRTKTKKSYRGKLTHRTNLFWFGRVNRFVKNDSSFKQLLHQLSTNIIICHLYGSKYKKKSKIKNIRRCKGTHSPLSCIKS